MSDIRIAVVTLTRDRLAFTQHCFARLHEHAGCSFDHFVLDNASQDGTVHWLAHDYDCELFASNVNMGISAGWNFLLDSLVNSDDYDAIVKFDNDAELVMPDTLATVCELAVTGGALLSPRILGLQNPPQHTREMTINGETILDVPQIGGVFLAAPAWIYNEFQYDEGNPKWGGDDVQLCRWFRDQGGTCGYVARLEAWHFLGTDGQRADPAQEGYYRRKDQEYAA